MAVTKSDAKTDTKADAVVEEKSVDVQLVAHQRYGFRGVTFEKQNTYTVSPAAAKELLSHRADNGQPVFIRTADIKPKEIPVEDQGPKTVNMASKSTLLAGIPDAVARKTFNITSDTEAAEMEVEIARRAAAEQASETAKKSGGEEQVEV